ncbi:MAG: DUF3093 domain-containing protein [Actinomycetota bacterium]|nr:DUF3093 domain-containing protein [Actinomycetota bacterium]
MTTVPAQYRETLRVPATWWLLGTGFAASVWWAFFVAMTWEVAIAAGVVAATLVATALWRYGSVRVVVDDDGLQAGRALLPHRYVGRVTPLDEAASRAAAGVDADARAFLMLRTYCRTAVRVTVDDDADPTPYWLVSTRRPDELSRCLTARTVQD